MSDEYRLTVRDLYTALRLKRQSVYQWIKRGFALDTDPQKPLIIQTHNGGYEISLTRLIELYPQIIPILEWYEEGMNNEDTDIVAHMRKRFLKPSESKSVSIDGVLPSWRKRGLDIPTKVFPACSNRTSSLIKKGDIDVIKMPMCMGQRDPRYLIDLSQFEDKTNEE